MSTDETPGEAAWSFEGSALQGYEAIQRRRGEGAWMPLREMLTDDAKAALEAALSPDGEG